MATIVIEDAEPGHMYVIQVVETYEDFDPEPDEEITDEDYPNPLRAVGE